MSARLYCFEGKAVTPAPGDCQVISWKRTRAEGAQYKMVTHTEAFDTYEAALAWIAGQSSGNYNIVSEQPVRQPGSAGGVDGFQTAP